MDAGTHVNFDAALLLHNRGQAFGQILCLPEFHVE